MTFNVERFNMGPRPDDLPTHLWLWRLMRADGTAICACAVSFATEEEARSDIAAAKKSMKGAWRCKVVTVDAHA